MTTTYTVTNQPVQQYSITGPPQMVVVPGKNTRNWSSGLCSCFDDIKSCCCVSFCGHCYLCYMYTEYGESCCTPICMPLSDLGLRIQHRNRFGIQGTVLRDCCYTTFCFKCSQCQLKRDMNYVRRDLGQSLY